MANRTVSVVLQAEIGQYVSGMTRAAAATKGLGQTAETTGRQSQRGFDLAGRGALLLGASVGAALVGIVTKSMEFEKAMSAVQAATGASASALGTLREAAMKAGADTQYSAVQAAQAITEMAKAGVSSADILNGGLNGALALAAAGQLDVAQAAGIASTAMTQFGLSGSQLPHVADLLAAGAGKAMGSVDDLGQALNQAGLLASATGISIEETTGALAAFASAGLIGSDAGTSFKTMLQQLQAPSKQSADLMAQLGINAYDAQGNFVGLEGLAGQLQSKLGGLTQAQRDSALAIIFGTDAARAANVLYREGADGIAEWTSKVNDAGYAQEQAAALTDNLSGDLERLGGSFDTLLITIGQGAQGPLRVLVQGLSGLLDLVGGAIDLFSGLPAPIQLAVGAFAAWAAIGDKVTEKLAPLKDAASGFLTSFSEALGYAKQNGDGLTEVLGSVGETAMDAAKEGLKDLAKAIGPELGMALATAAVSLLVDTFFKIVDAGDAAAKEIDDFNDSLRQIDSNAARFEAISTGLEDFRDKLRDTQSILDEGFQFSSDDWTANLLGTNAILATQAGRLQDAKASAEEYAAEIEKLEGKQRRTNAAADELSTRLGISRDQVLELADKYGVDLSGSLDSVVGRFLLMKNSQEQVDTATGNATLTLDVYTEQLQNVADAADAAKKQTDLFKLSLDILTGAHISLAEAQSAMFAALDAASGAMDELGGAVLNASGQLNLQSENGRKAQDVLIGIKDAGNEYIATLIQQGATAEEVQKADADLRASFINSATQMGISSEAANHLADQILGIPSERTTKINADTAAANSAVTHTQTLIDNLHGKTVTVSVRADGTVAAILGGSNISPFIVNARASGGPIAGPGGPTDDRAGLYALSDGEYVVRSASVSKYGLDFMDALNQGRVQVPGYAAGGIVVNVDGSPLVSTLRDVGSGMKRLLEPGTRALSFAKSQVGKPYIWGGVGPGGYDCSGFMSAITNVLRGRSPYSRVGSTATFPWPGFAAGYGGLFTIGSTSSVRGGVGHMAGNLLGLNVESTGGVGVRVGSGARGPDWGYFNTRAHLAMAGGGVIGEPVAGVGRWSGRSYSFAEQGDEIVMPRGREVSGYGRSGGRGGSGAPPQFAVYVQIGDETLEARSVRVVENVLSETLAVIHRRGAYNG